MASHVIHCPLFRGSYATPCDFVAVPTRSALAMLDLPLRAGRQRLRRPAPRTAALRRERIHRLALGLWIASRIV